MSTSFLKQRIGSIITALVLAAVFSAGITLAAAIWQGTDWIQSGSVISAEKTRDNFDYLYARVGSIPVCVGADKALQWNGSAWLCATIGSGSAANGGSSTCPAVSYQSGTLVPVSGGEGATCPESPSGTSCTLPAGPVYSSCGSSTDGRAVCVSGTWSIVEYPQVDDPPDCGDTA